MTSVDEKWAPVNGYEGVYEVSTKGRVRSCNRVTFARDGRTYRYKARVLSPSINCGGYRNVSLCCDGKQTSFLVHVLVANAFLKNRPTGCEINHKNGSKADNTVENLEYLTPSQNMRHASANNLLSPAMGERNLKSKLDRDRVEVIRRMRKQGSLLRDIAACVGVSIPAVSSVLTGRTWRHVQ